MGGTNISYNFNIRPLYISTTQDISILPTISIVNFSETQIRIFKVSIFHIS